MDGDDDEVVAVVVVLEKYSARKISSMSDKENIS